MRKFLLNHIPAVLYGEPSDKVFLYVHGRGGNKEVAVSFYQMVKKAGWQVLSIDLPKHGERQESAEKFNPWTIVPELSLLYSYACDQWETIGLCADGIGTYFSLRAFQMKPFDQALFISPIVDMAEYIDDALAVDNITPDQLKAEGRLDTSEGVHLSWDYYLYTHENPIKVWPSPTEILYGDQDDMMKRSSLEGFCDKFQCGLTVIEGGDHGFTREEDQEIVENWVKETLK